MPALVSGQQLASSRLDERSALTYLSLWPRAPDGPGFKATLAFVHRTLPGSHKRPSNFGVRPILLMFSRVESHTHTLSEGYESTFTNKHFSPHFLIIQTEH